MCVSLPRNETACTSHEHIVLLLFTLHYNVCYASRVYLPQFGVPDYRIIKDLVL